ncbi:hypothetical protein BDZ89DRAFT_1046344 [Hymenopellis radicata]|nr:hypothetical protein BDZ89DRAFT_1046344 [Hymenopellis radicata]
MVFILVRVHVVVLILILGVHVIVVILVLGISLVLGVRIGLVLGVRIGLVLGVRIGLVLGVSVIGLVVVLIMPKHIILVVAGRRVAASRTPMTVEKEDKKGTPAPADVAPASSSPFWMVMTRHDDADSASRHAQSSAVKRRAQGSVGKPPLGREAMRKATAVWECGGDGKRTRRMTKSLHSDRNLNQPAREAYVASRAGGKLTSQNSWEAESGDLVGN